MEDFFSDTFNPPARHQETPVVLNPFDANTVADIAFAEFQASLQPAVNVNDSSASGSAMDALWTLMDDPSPQNDTSKLFGNIATSKRPKTTSSSFRNNGMLTRKIHQNQISKITPSAKRLIDAYFLCECMNERDVIIPECIGLLVLFHLGHPAFTHCYLCSDNGSADASTRKLFVVFGYHEMDDIVSEYLNFLQLHEKQSDHAHQDTTNDTMIDELFNETMQDKEYRVWKRPIAIPVPPYNGRYKELFDHIDELLEDAITIFESNTGSNDGTTAAVAKQYSSWDQFLDVEPSNEETQNNDDDWKIVDSSSGNGENVTFKNDTVPEIELLVEQKSVLSGWIRIYEAPKDPWMVGMKNLVHMKWDRDPFHKKTSPKLLAFPYYT